jgi:Family of unknown function (DUF5946)
MTRGSCPECGAPYPNEAVTCEARFHVLLALDHSRQEPWGSRHGQAFAAFALQHPAAFPTSLDAAWSALYRIYCFGELAADVFASVREGRARAGDSTIPVRPPEPIAHPSITIMDLHDFAASTYATQLNSTRDAGVVGRGDRCTGGLSIRVARVRPCGESSQLPTYGVAVIENVRQRSCGSNGPTLGSKLPVGVE